MKKTLTKFASFSLAASVVLSGIPFNTVSAAGLSQIQSSHVTNGSLLDIKQEVKGAKISENIDTKSKKKISVIVQFKTNPVVVAKSLASKKELRSFSEKSVDSAVNQEQKSFKKAAEKSGIDLDVQRKFSYLINAMEIEVPANQVPELAKLPNVVSVYENSTYYALPIEKEGSVTTQDSKTRYDMNPLKQIGVPEAWAKKLTGKGVKVGVIDTGVDYLHPDLKDAFKGGYDSIDDDDDPYETMPVQEYPTEHGSHVSGTIVGRNANKDSDKTVKGIAYEADLYVYRVLGPSPTGGTGSSAQVIDGIEHAVKDGMDVINLSLGSDDNHDPFSPDSIALTNATLAGVVACVANGNAGPRYYTAGTPADALLPISVGAATTPVDTYKASLSVNLGGGKAQDFELYAMGWEKGNNNFASLLGAKPLTGVYANIGTEDDFKKVDVKGKVALVGRGTIDMGVKITNAKKAGAVAVVMFNGNGNLDFPGRTDYIQTFLGDDPGFVPAFNMKGAEGRKLAKEMLANPDKPVNFTFGAAFDAVTKPGDEVAEFSSRGPAMDGNYAIKPDLLAPGTAILSSVPAYGKENKDASYSDAYARLQGTSMAAPHIAGLAALLKQEHPEWTPYDVKAALANTAEEIKDPSNKLYDVYTQGAGRVNMANAIKTPALLETVEKVKVMNTDHTTKEIIYNGDNISFGLMAAGSKPVTKELQIKNTSDDQVTYEAEVVMHGDDAEDIKVNVDQDIVKASRGKATSFHLELSPSKNTKDGIYEGEVLLKSKDGNPDLHLPFVVHVGDKREDNSTGFDEYELSNGFITPNGDGKDDSIDVTAVLQADDINLVTLEVYGYDDKFIGTLAEYMDLDEAGEPTWKNIKPGNIKFEGIDGSYVDGSKDSRGREIVKHLANGEYQMVIAGYVYDPEKKTTENYYTAYKTFSIKDSSVKIDKDQLKKDVAKAAANFVPNSVNTKVVGDAVLSLPTHVHNLTYEVISSSKKNYISKDGILLELPTKETKVTLKVKIASAYDSSINKIIKFDVTLPAKE
ncbi:S8 family serine peptidase [Brevibacillus ginsengisoli]|uniref:S8 family serine peptidase n=1 Tax=Brevibacillus ginsengisoli TaxID=363854 RepID=UPI003CEB3E01